MKITVKNTVFEVFTQDAGYRMLSGVKKDGVKIHEWSLPTYSQNRRNLRSFMRRASEKTCKDLATNYAYLN